MKLLKTCMFLLWGAVLVLAVSGCFMGESGDCGNPIEGRIYINNDDEVTFDRDVEVTLDVTGATEMCISSEATASCTDYIDFAPVQTLRLPAEYGTRTVQVHFKNGSCREIFSDTITLNAGNANTFSVNNDGIVTNSATVSIDIEVRVETVSPVSMRFSNDNSTWSEWENYATEKTWDLSQDSGQKTVYAEFKFTDGDTRVFERQILLLYGERLTSPSSQGEDSYGFSVTVSSDGNTIVVGAPTGEAGKGCVYVHKKSGESWDTTKLTAVYGSSGDNFGRRIAVSANGNRIIAGAKDVDYSGVSSGAAYIFDWNGSDWDETRLTASDSHERLCFGSRVSISADGAVIAISTVLGEGINPVYIYKEDNNAWIEIRILPSDNIGINGFGNSLSLSSDGNILAVGAPLDDSGSFNDCGSLYVYKFIDSSWEETRVSYHDSSTKYHYFGTSVAISSDGNTIAAGAPGPAYSSFIGYVRLLQWDGSAWNETGKLEASDGQEGAYFGATVAMSSDGSTVAVGSPFSDDWLGSAYIYQWDSTEWTEMKVAQCTRRAHSAFGYSAAITSDGTRIILGDYEDREEGDDTFGAVYLCDLL